MKSVVWFELDRATVLITIINRRIIINKQCVVIFLFALAMYNVVDTII